jgi:hypothetical protein
MDQKRYEQTLLACALVKDLASLPAGDKTEIGEKVMAWWRSRSYSQFN